MSTTSFRTASLTVIELPLSLPNSLFQQYRASFAINIIDPDDLDPDDEVGRDMAESEFRFLREFPDTSLEAFIEQGQGGRLALDVLHTTCDSLEVHFTFWNANPPIAVPEPLRRQCPLEEINRTLARLLHDQYAGPPSSHLVGLRAEFYPGSR